MKNMPLSLMLKIILSITLIVFLITKIKFNSFEKLSANISLYIILNFSITLLSVMFMSIRWKVLCKSIDISPRLNKLYKFYIKGMFYNIFLPGAIGGDIMRTRDLIVTYNVVKRKAIILTLVERIGGLYVLLLVGAIGILFINIPKGLIMIPIEIFYLFLLFIIVSFPVVKWIVNKRIDLAYDTIIQVLLLSFIAQFGDIIIAWNFSQYFDLQIPFSQFLVIMPIVYMATILPISLGGLGVREVTFVAILSLYSVETSIAVLISFLMYFVKVLVGVSGWLVFLKSDIKKKTLI